MVLDSHYSSFNFECYMIFANPVLFLTSLLFLSKFGILDLRNRVTQNDVTIRVTNLKMFKDVPLSS